MTEIPGPNPESGKGEQTGEQKKLSLRQYIGLTVPHGGRGFRRYLTGNPAPIDIQVANGVRNTVNKFRKKPQS